MNVEDLCLIKKLDQDAYGDTYLSSKKGDNAYYSTHIYKKSDLSKYDESICLNNQISIIILISLNFLKLKKLKMKYY